MKEYPIVPGRGIVSIASNKERIDYLKALGFNVDLISSSGLDISQIHHNIESYIGSVEIPVGLVGPLTYRHNNSEEMVYTMAATLEGALIASMNRGAKAVSMCNGFESQVLYQKMVRCPMFIFDETVQCLIFSDWLQSHKAEIISEAEKHSNHAKLIEINPVISAKSVHIYFVYTTGDASGQNMTTSCTWHAILWIKDQFTNSTGTEPLHFVIEGNGASDKKVSLGNIQRGRGVNVIAECELEERVIERILRTKSDDLLRCFEASLPIASTEGMIGYNINVSNAIASIFAATGQDLASIHESSTGILTLNKTEDGLHFKLQLPNLVIGTVGGGTHLPKQNEALRLMDCLGPGKIERFASLIAGFALSLEISTFSAIVGGQFAKAHEKLGRNKPVNWLTRSEISHSLIAPCIQVAFFPATVGNISNSNDILCENGIIISLTNRINKKLTGFLTLDAELIYKGQTTHQKLLLKSKPLDSEVIRGLHLMASAVDPELATYIHRSGNMLEYKNCHSKELAMNSLLAKHHFSCMPQLFGTFIDEKREIYLLLTELLDLNEMEVFNAENSPGLWTDLHIRTAIHSITQVHKRFAPSNGIEIPESIVVFEPWNAIELYNKFAEILMDEYHDSKWNAQVSKLPEYLKTLKSEHDRFRIQKTIIHNDFNSRNVGIRKNGEVCIYDWELAVLHFPHRDIVEFLSFTLPENFEESYLQEMLIFHTDLYQPENRDSWKKCYLYCLKEYLITRISFYLTGKIVLDFAITERIVNNTFRMIEILESAE